MNTKLLKRLENIEKIMIPKDADVIVFIEEAEEPGKYTIDERVYYGEKGHLKDTFNKWTIEAGNIEEAFETYTPPKGCKELIVFLHNIEE